jgi:peptidyl-prolyl cis-trans isomerase-like 2
MKKKFFLKSISPVTNKVFNNSSHIVAIRTSGNVYSYSAIEELNLKPKNFVDLIDGTKFTRDDIIILQDPQNLEIMAKRDISQFQYLQQMRDHSKETRKQETKCRHTTASENVMKEIERTKQAQELLGIRPKLTSEILHPTLITIEQDVARFQSLSPLTQDVTPGQISTIGKTSSSLTSSIIGQHTMNNERVATAEEIREARWKILRKLKQKSLIQLQTTHGNLNLEIHTDIAPRTSWNFVTLCKNGFYQNTIFHRLVPNFMIQGGDPTGTGSGGASSFGNNGEAFADEFDNRLIHDKRGILSMANAGANTNTSQFFITFAAASHLNFRHPIFGRVVGGLNTLDRMEQVSE